jgi:hypothetical protein
VIFAGLIVRKLGPSEFFPLTAAILAVTIVWALTQTSWREFGTPTAPTPPIPGPFGHQ